MNTNYYIIDEWLGGRVDCLSETQVEREIANLEAQDRIAFDDDGVITKIDGRAVTVEEGSWKPTVFIKAAPRKPPRISDKDRNPWFWWDHRYRYRTY